jgi:hypothetical protein
MGKEEVLFRNFFLQEGGAEEMCGESGLWNFVIMPKCELQEEITF